MTEIVVGSRVRTDEWPDLRRQTGRVCQINKDWAQVLWDRHGHGASWLPLERLVDVPG